MLLDVRRGVLGFPPLAHLNCNWSIKVNGTHLSSNTNTNTNAWLGKSILVQRLSQFLCAGEAEVEC